MSSLVNIDENFKRSLETDLEQTGLVSAFNQVDLTALDEKSPSIVQLKETIVSMVDCECHRIILWAKSIPDFGQLCLDDQATSIELNFLDVVVTNYIWRSAKYPLFNESSKTSSHYNLVMHANVVLGRPLCEKLNLTEMFDQLMALVSKFRMMAVTQEEFVCLKALSLFKSDYGFQDLHKMDALRKKFSNQLRKTIRASFGEQGDVDMEWLNRYDSVLLLLTDIKSLSIRFMQYIIMFHADQQKNMPILLYDMFLSHNMYSMFQLNQQADQVHHKPSSSPSSTFSDADQPMATM